MAARAFSAWGAGASGADARLRPIARRVSARVGRAGSFSRRASFPRATWTAWRVLIGLRRGVGVFLSAVTSCCVGRLAAIRAEKAAAAAAPARVASGNNLPHSAAAVLR